MNSRWAILVSLVLIAFACLTVTWQIVYRTAPVPFLIQSCKTGERLAKVSSIVDRDREGCDASASDRQLDLTLPPDARVFVMDMTGPTNHYKAGYYHYLTYYLSGLCT